MSQVAIPSRSSNWVPLSGSYSLDENIIIDTIPFTTLDGYKGFYQKINSNPKDHTINKETIFTLPDSMRLLDFLHDKGRPTVYTGGYSTITTSINGAEYYVSVINDGQALSLTLDESLAMFARFVINDDNTISIYYGKDRLVTTSKYEPLNLYLDKPLTTTESYRQKYYYEILEDNKIRIISHTPKRYWAYRTVQPNRHIIRANGYNNNSSVFTINNFSEVLSYTPKGLITNHTWVNYYNTLEDKTNNNNVVLNNKIEISAQHLIDNPYHTSNIETSTVNINIANLKNIMTAEYQYKTNVILSDKPLNENNTVRRDTDIYAVFDTTSMQVTDGQAAAQQLIDWHENVLPQSIPNYIGNLYICVDGSERWLDLPLRIHNKTGSLASTTGSFSAVAPTYRPVWNTIDTPTNFVCLAFFDESSDLAFNTDITYHIQTGATTTNHLSGQPTNRYKTDFNNYISLYNTIKASNGFMKNVIYPIVQNYPAPKVFIAHAIAALYGRQIPADELNILYTVNPQANTYSSFVNTLSSLPAKYIPSNLNGVDPSGLIHYNWRGEWNKTSPAANVFSSASFARELTDLLLN